MNDKKAKNCINALRAAINSINDNDDDSALDYLAVAAAELCDKGGKAIGASLIFLTEDAAECVARGVIDLEKGK